MKAFVTGGAGFIGSTLTDRLAARGDEVVVYDNFSTGRTEFLEPALATGRVRVIRGDILDVETLNDAMRGSDMVFHFAANADVRFGTLKPRRDLEQNTIATFNVLDAMRTNGVSRLAFSSTGSVYGDTNVIPTPEDAPFPIQTSLYAASKVAGEAMIQAYCEGYGMRAWIFRFVSILGERYLHGHVFDFCRKLREDPEHLHILGDGNQRKSYLYVADCITAVLQAVAHGDERVNIFNLGTEEYSTVNQSVAWITETLGLSPELTYEGGTRGWIGDNPFILLDTKRIQALGWRPTLSIRDAIIRTVEYLQNHRHLLDRDGR